MRSFRRIAVYCGSSNDVSGHYLDAAARVGRILADHDIEIVYGAGNIGMMGALADAALDAGGHIKGVIPDKLRARELAHGGIGELVVVDSMHARKMIMAALSDAFIGLPGGFGTLDELFEAITWNQLGYHAKPVGLLNINGYFDSLIAFLDRARDEGFVRPEHRELVAASDDPAALLGTLRSMEIHSLDGPAE